MMPAVRIPFGYPVTLLTGNHPRIARLVLVLSRSEAMVWDRDQPCEPRLVWRSDLRNKGGRPDSTADMAEFVHERKRPHGSMTMTEIAVAWTAAFPDDPRTKGLPLLRRIEKLRGAWRRYFGDKKRSKPRSDFSPPRPRQ